MNIEKFESLNTQVINWGNDRGLLTNVNQERLDGQSLKLIEEAGELCAGILKNNKTKQQDSIGDVAVVISLYAKMRGVGLNVGLIKDIVSSYEATNNVKFKVPDVIYWFFNHNYEVALAVLHQVAKGLDLDMVDCFEVAYIEIKDRKGKLTGSTFIKEEDLVNG